MFSVSTLLYIFYNIVKKHFTVRNPVLTGNELCMHVLYSGKMNLGELSFSSLTLTRTKEYPHLAPWSQAKTTISYIDVSSRSNGIFDTISPVVYTLKLKKITRCEEVLPFGFKILHTGYVIDAEYF